MNISNYNKAEVLAALYNGSSAQGMGFLDPNNRNQMSVEQAQEMLNSGQTYFDYVNGRVLKVDLSGDELDPYLYDRDRGQGACERIINRLSPRQSTVSSYIPESDSDDDTNTMGSVMSAIVADDIMSSAFDDNSSSCDSSPDTDSSSDYSGQGGDFGGGGSSADW